MNTTVGHVTGLAQSLDQASPRPKMTTSEEYAAQKHTIAQMQKEEEARATNTGT
jgi:hypothetical protein